MEVVKSMIHDYDLPMHIWEEAARTTVYVQNKSPHRLLGNKTREEMFSREKPQVVHLIIFGFPVYVHVPKEKRSRLVEMLLSMRMQLSVDQVQTI